MIHECMQSQKVQYATVLSKGGGGGGTSALFHEILNYYILRSIAKCCAAKIEFLYKIYLLSTLYSSRWF